MRAPSTNAICLVCRPPVRTVCEVLPELTQGEGEGQWLKEQLTEAAKPEAGGDRERVQPQAGVGEARRVKEGHGGLWPPLQGDEGS